MNLHTLHFEHAVLLTVYTVLAAANSFSCRHLKGVHSFTLYNLLAMLGALAVVGRHTLPDFVSIAVGNVLVVAAYFLLFLSISALLGGRPLHTLLQVALLVLGSIAMLQWGYFTPDTAIRLIALSLALGLQQLLTCLFILRTRESAHLKAALPLAGCLAALCLVNLSRIAEVLVDGAPVDYLQSGPPMAWAVLFITCMQCGAIVAYVWMTASILRSELEHQASTDPLTGLLNRRAMAMAAERELASTRLRRGPLAAILMDLDGFKPINDNLGHEAGDMALVAAAANLRRELRSGDLLARMGGDEFAVLLPSTLPEAALEIAGRLRVAVATPSAVPEPGPGLTASFGVGHCTGGCTWAQLLRGCDEALYRAKRAGGNAIVLSAAVDLPELSRDLAAGTSTPAQLAMHP